MCRKLVVTNKLSLGNRELGWETYSLPKGEVVEFTGKQLKDIIRNGGPDEVYGLKISEETGELVFDDSSYVTNMMNKLHINTLVPVVEDELKVEEYMYLMACDAADHVKGLFIVSQGMINGTLLNVYGIIARTLLCGATQIILAHNHPSGACVISKEDEACCKQLKLACEIMGITLMDFMVLGNWEYSSFKEKWLL